MSSKTIQHKSLIVTNDMKVEWLERIKETLKQQIKRDANQH